ncbi:type II toxin-antitoxin system Phd/YefM family antitoxin [Thermomonas sp.]|uniref:type II toxin-antitoxin system Phd/YefM family antitoxin n=1 Tax=Thermomonas sp. TaxID=1971895 RepID=UPI0024891D4C|nr:type II toxin-antitoxin system Phd/YefM family antitoxin [Thermomonas sp.]MDI1252452.1 type II toxin-antitoxin system Phd/YefM family antitoxin [Thermomonas sp.]
MAAVALSALENLPRTPASDVKKLGWRGVMKTIARSGKVVVTNHDEPEAVILSAEEYTAILDLLHKAADRDAAALDVLRRKFDKRLESLDAPDAGEKLRDILRKPLDLAGEIMAGKHY